MPAHASDTTVLRLKLTPASAPASCSLEISKRPPGGYQEVSGTMGFGVRLQIIRLVLFPLCKKRALG